MEICFARGWLFSWDGAKAECRRGLVAVLSRPEERGLAFIKVGNESRKVPALPDVVACLKSPKRKVLLSPFFGVMEVA